MNELDRKNAPEFKAIERIEYIKAQEQKLANGIPLYVIDAANLELVRIDIIFEAGEWNQVLPMQANYTISMLCEGSIFHTAEQIAEKLDFLGSYVYYNSQKHNACITVYSLNKYLEETVQLIEEIIKSPLFPENEFNTFNNKRKQQYIIDGQKVEVMAQKQFQRSLFGTSHPYGVIPELSDFENINIGHLQEFHTKHFTSATCKIVVSGKVTEAHVKLIERHFGDSGWGSGLAIEQPHHQICTDPRRAYNIPREGSVQCAMRIGKITINKLDPDFHYLGVVNMILGGYFGSRLMSNIREEKGYTYGIGSGVVSQLTAGYFTVVSEVGKNVVNDALKEVYKEIERLQNELVPEGELTLVKNYMMGTILRNFDGPFALSDAFKGILEYNLGYDYFDAMVDVVKNITPRQIMQQACKHLDINEMHEIIAG